MTLDEKLAITNKAAFLRQAGDVEGANRLIMSVPLPPYMAKVAKKTMGKDFLLNGGWNLSEAEAEFGAGWLDR
jgi:hypothetical protein